jgi:hypothetical protein
MSKNKRKTLNLKCRRLNRLRSPIIQFINNLKKKMANREIKFLFNFSTKFLMKIHRMWRAI